MEKIVEFGNIGKHRERIRKVKDDLQIAKQILSQCRICQMDYDNISDVLHIL
jgi:hypothetical protein